MMSKQILRNIVRLSVSVILLAALAGPAFSHIGVPPHPGESPGPAHPYQGSHDGPTADSNPCGSPIDSINTYTGNLTVQDIPVFYRSVGDGVPFVVTYNSQSTRSSTLGPGWTHSYAAHVVDASYWDGVVVVDENGWEHFFHDGLFDLYVSPPGVFDRLWLTWYASTWTGWKLIRPNGRELHFDTDGRLVERRDADGLTWALSYSGELLTTITDPMGRDTSLQYNQANHLSRVTVPGGLYADFAYDYLGRLTQITDAAGDAYSFGGYLGTNTFLGNITDPSGREVWYQYGALDGKAAVIATGITEVPGSTVTYDYTEQPNGQLYVEITAQKDGQDRITRHVYENTDDPDSGRYFTTLLQVVEDYGDGSHVNAAVAFAYDSELRAVKFRDSYEPESGGKDHVHRFYYQDQVNPSCVTKYIDPENYDPVLGDASPSYLFTYNACGDPAGTTSPEGRAIDATYVAGSRRLSSVTIHDEDINGSPVDHTTYFTYYGAGYGYQLETITDARGNTTTLYYDSQTGYLTTVDPPLGNNWTFTSSLSGDITSVTDGNGNTTSFSHDGIHRLTQITYPDVGAGQKTRLFDWLCCGLESVTDENGMVTRFQYDPYTHSLTRVIEDYGGLNYQTDYGYDEVGNVTSVTNARGHTQEYTWDGADRLVRMDYPDSTYETWTLWDDGRIWQHRDGRGRVTTYRYDADDRLAGSGSYVAINYPNDTDVKIVRDDDGLVTSFTDGTGSSSRVYYPSSWVKSVTNGMQETVTYEYNGVGDVSRVKTPDDLYFQYTYDARNQLNWMKSPNYIEFNFTYDNGGRRYRTTQPTVMYREYRYNARDWYTGLRHWGFSGGEWLYNPYYYYNDGALWDHTGNPLRRLEYFPGEGNYYHITTFRYDGVYRQTEETRRDYWGALEYSLTYGYDAVGNRTSMTRDGTSYTYTYDDNDKLTAVSGGGQSASFGYDGAGNMTSVSGTMFGSWTLSYDDESRLTSVTYPGGTDSFSYNAFGQKMRAVLGGTAYRYVYHGDRVMEETNDAGNVTTRYMTEGGSYSDPLINQFRTGCGCRWPLEDGAGNVRGLAANIEGAVSDWYELDAFGVNLASTGTTRNDYRFGGAWGYLTDSSGLLQLGHRFYWPEIGRFIQQDPIGDGMNWYAYAGNNPLRWVDPRGLEPTGLGPYVPAPGAMGAEQDPEDDPCPGVLGPLVTAGGIVIAAIGEAAGRAGDTALQGLGTWAKGLGYVTSLLGGYLTYRDTRPKAEAVGDALTNKIHDPAGTGRGDDTWEWLDDEISGGGGYISPRGMYRGTAIRRRYEDD